MKYLAVAFLLGGCGADIDDLYGEASSSGAGGDGSGASTSASSSNGGAPNSSSNAGGAPTNANSATTSNAGGMATTDVTTMTTGPAPSSSQQTTTGIPEGVFVKCGDTACEVGNGTVCCIQATGSSCVAEEDCGAFGTPATCDDPFDCANGEVCCGHTDGGFYDEITCDSDCEWPNRTVCALDGPACEPIPGDNGPIPTQCGQSSVLPDGYLVCKP